MAASAKPLFRAIAGQKPEGNPAPLFSGALPAQRAPDQGRDPLDYDPTPASATAAFLAAENEHINVHPGKVWESAVGGGHMAHVLQNNGHEVIGSDVVNRGYPDVILQSLYDFDEAPSSKMITNPPYCEISARDGQGRWLKHALGLGCGYIAFLLNADWPAARINGLDELLHDHPPSIEYLCCWKIDFRGLGAPPQRNSWFVWDTNRPAPTPNAWLRTRLYRDFIDPRQEVLL